MIKLPNVMGLVKVGKNFLKAYRPELLLGATIASSVAGSVLAAKGGYEARGIILAKEHPEHADLILQKSALPVKEQIQLTWLCYVPSVVATTTAIGSVSGLHLVHVKEKRAIATAALAAVDEVKAEFKRYEKENLGIVSPEEREEILNKRADETGGFAVAEYADGEVEELYLVRDGRTGRDIFSNQRRIEEAVLTLNNFIARHGDCDINSFYENAGFDTTPDGEDWGWSGAWVELVWDTTVRDDGRPVRRFEFRTRPKEGYDLPNS